MNPVFVVSLAGFVLVLAVRAQEDLMSDCPSGEEEARKCQMRLQSVITPMVKRPLFMGDRIKICCNVAHGIDCLIHEAFPKCEEAERKDLMAAANSLIWDFPLLQMSCQPYEFVNREPPEACDGLVDGFPPRSRTPLAVILLSMGLAAILLIAAALLIRYRFRNRNNQSPVELHGMN